MLQEDLTKFFELKVQAEAIKTQIDLVRESIKTQLPSENFAKTMVHMPNGVVTVAWRSRGNRKCDWKLFQSIYPEVYTYLVTESTTEYLSITKKSV